MNKISTLQVLMSLFNNLPYLEVEIIDLKNSQDVLTELQKKGLSDSVIEKALSWLERFGNLDEASYINYRLDTVRIFTSAEKAVIPERSLHFLLKAYTSGEIQSYELEFIIEQIMALSEHCITEEQFLWVFEMTIANQKKDSFGNKITSEELYSKSLYVH